MTQASASGSASSPSDSAAGSRSELRPPPRGGRRGDLPLDLAQFPLHGLAHWERVGRNGLDLAADTEGADVDVVLLFALFHDSMRLNDGHDPEHGGRGGVVARELRKLPPLDDDQLALLQEACAWSTDAGRLACS